MEQALEALDNMDDYARMPIGVNPIGPRGVLLDFIEQAIIAKPMTFSDFIRNASTREKEKVYLEVMEKACERQKKVIEESQVSNCQGGRCKYFCGSKVCIPKEES